LASAPLDDARTDPLPARRRGRSPSRGPDLSAPIDVLNDVLGLGSIHVERQDRDAVLASVLEQQQMDVVYAENGKDGIEMLNSAPDVDVVLMDVMMPEMDGYEATRAIRRLKKFRSIPIIALTAKAMKGDREKCIEAGASDYIAKPVDNEQLISLLRVWLYR